MQRKKQGWHHLVLALVAASLVSSIEGQDAASRTAAAAAANPAAVATVVSAVANSTAAGDSNSNGRISCRVHVVNNTGTPTTFGHVQSSLKISSAADIADVSVIVQVQHPDVAQLEITLSAAASSGSSSKVVLKSPAVGVVGGANMIQTIFSDWAPGPFPNDVSQAPYSSVYRPSQPFHSLVSGNSTAAGAGGSKGVWTLYITDKASGVLSRRPLKLAGWELWLCGESEGRLFVPVDSKDDVATAFDGSDMSPSVVKKAVTTSKSVDVNVLVKSGYRAEQVAQDPINHVIHTINSYLAKGLAAEFKQANASLTAVNPELAAHLSSTIDKVQSRLQELPALMGYEQGADGSWGLPTSESMITSFLDTLTHCHYDLYWCWENTGLRGNFALDFANTWDAASGPAAAAWSATQEQWSKALAGFEDSFPEYNSWSDVLFYSVIDTLYRAAAADAVFSVEEAYFDTAIRLAIYASPIRFAVNPRAFIVQLFSVLSDAVNDVFLALEFAPELIDNNNNNDVAAITAIATALADGTRSTLSLLTQGLNLRAQGMQQVLSQSAGSLATRAADMNGQLSQAIAQISPDLGAMFEAAAQPTSDVLRSIAQNRQDTMQQYFKNQNYRQVLGSQLNHSIDLMGNVTVSMATRAAEAFKTAQNALDKALPGPSLEMVIGNLRGNISGILEDAHKALEKLLPIPELKEFDQLTRATIDSIVELLNESAKQVQTSDGAKAIQKQLNALAEGLNKAQKGVGQVFNGIVKGFPGPLLNSTIGVIQREANKTINDVNNLFKQLNTDFPNLDPNKFIEQLGKTLDQLLSDTLGQSNAFQALAPFNAAQQLSAALPGVLGPVGNAVQQAQLLANAALPAAVTGGINSTKLSEIQKGIEQILNSYSQKVGSIASSLPLQPPVANITDNLTQRSQQVGQQVNQQSNQFVAAVADGLNQPYKIMTAGVSDLNNNLEALLRDLESQSSRADELSKVLAQGPLQNIPLQINQTLDNVLGGFHDAAQSLQGLLPDLPDLRKQLDALLGAPLRDLEAQLHLAGNETIKAAKAASSGLVSGLATALQGINKVLIDGQWQLAGLLGSVVQATKQLDTAASALNHTLAPQLQSLDSNMAELAKSVSSDLEKKLEALRPPIAVLENIIRPLASALNAQLGNITQILTLSGPNVQMGVNGVLQQLQAVAGSLINSTSSALGLPPLPQLPPLPLLPGMNISQLNSTSPIHSTGKPGNTHQIHNLTPPNGQMGVNGLLQQLQTIAGALINGNSSGLGLPSPPQLPPLPPLPGMNISQLNSTLPGGVLQQLQTIAGALINSNSSGLGLPPLPPLPLLQGINPSQLGHIIQTLISTGQLGNIIQAFNSTGQLGNIIQAFNSTGQLGNIIQAFDSTGQLGNIIQAFNSTGQLGNIIQAFNSTGQLGNIIQAFNSTGQLGNIIQAFNITGQLGNIIQAFNGTGQLGNIIQALISTGQLGNIMQAFNSNGQLGNIAKRLGLHGSDVQTGVNGALQQLQTTAGNLVKHRSGPLGRHLLRSSGDNALPVLEVAFNIPDLSGTNGTSFNPVAFRQAVVSGMEDAVNSFANDFVGSVLGLRGVSQMDGVNSVMQSLSHTLNDAVKQLRESAAELPKGPVFEFLTTGNKEALQPLKQLQQTLVTAANGTAVDPAELSALFSQAGGILQALGGPVQQMTRTANSGDVVKQLAQQFTTVADAAGKMLEGMKGNLHSWSSQLA